VELLVVGFVLTTVLGGLLGFWFQSRAWSHQHEVQQRDQEYDQALRTFGDVSTLLDKRLYRMRRLYWAARRNAHARVDRGAVSAARDEYVEVLYTWNDNLNRNLALTQTYFGTATRLSLEHDILAEYAALGRILDPFVRLILSTDDPVTDPALGRRLDVLGKTVYVTNVQMLHLLHSHRLGDAAPRGASGVGKRLLERGMTGVDVLRLQLALRRAGTANIALDGHFGEDTESAVKAIQRAHDLPADGIVGPATQSVLPPGGQMPLLRIGMSGDAVAQLQRVLGVTQDPAGEFGRSTQTAVARFQEQQRIDADGIVGDRTWNCPLADGRTLEAAVGLGYAGDH
jgi:Putative peptidoglycan binding domain